MSRKEAAEAQPGPQPVPRARVSDDVRGALDRAGRLLGALESGLDAATARADAADRRARALEVRVAALEQGERELVERLVAAERYGGRLMSLYVATYQLHATLDPNQVQQTIAEIAVNLLGAQRYALLLKSERPGFCDLSVSDGVPRGDASPFQGDIYVGGDPVIDATLADGTLRLGAPGSTPVAVIPLTIQGSVVGVLVLFQLYGHRRPLDDEDRELFDLVSAHAASALLAARAFATTDRKLRTLQSLMDLVRGGRR